VRERIRFDLDRIVRVGPREAKLTTAFRPYDTAERCPRSRRWVEPGRRFGAADRYFSLAGLQVWGLTIRTALPEERGLAAIVAGGEWLQIFPDTANTEVILKVPSYSRKVCDHWPKSPLIRAHTLFELPL
jgi:hypothetical protein